MRILIGSPIRQKPNILQEFLNGLSEIEHNGIELEFFFVDDNTDYESTLLLEKYANNYKVLLKKGTDLFLQYSNDQYKCNDVTHYWTDSLEEKVAGFKDAIIDYAKNHKFDYLFLVDSDIVLDKRTLLKLISCNVDIVANVFWTQWFPGDVLRPQCFEMKTMSGSKADVKKKTIDMHVQMRIPGLYEVNGTGACTLISYNALSKGVSFKKITNISLHGEDRDFCVRANVLGFKLYMDTTYPAYHIYRDEYLDRVEEFKRHGFRFDMCQTKRLQKETKKKNIIKRGLLKALSLVNNRKLTRIKKNYRASSLKGNMDVLCYMVVHNEEGRYLEKSISSVKGFVDYFLIIDDASTDSTRLICEQLLNDVPHKIVTNKKSLFYKEYILRKKAWDSIKPFRPKWVLALDADEVFEKNVSQKIKTLINIPFVDALSFRFFDMWNENEYRDDKLWNAHKRFFTIMCRYSPDFIYKWKETNQHCGRTPKNIKFLSTFNVDIKIMHYGWAKESDRLTKYNRYMELDKDGKSGSLEHYKSILDKNPHLLPFNNEDLS